MSFNSNAETIDWANWSFTEKAVLCFVCRGSELLLIHKKTGLGAGKVNAPGGRIEKDESAYDAAVRECTEETGITPVAPVKRGELSFIFADGYSLHGTVFFAEEFFGTMIQTREADPFWCERKDIPYNDMWSDDRWWLPIALEGCEFDGRFVFDGDIMLSGFVIGPKGITSVPTDPSPHP